MEKAWFIKCDDGTVLNVDHVVCLEVAKNGPKWQVRARTTLDAEFSTRTIFLVRDDLKYEADARTLCDTLFIR